VSERLPALVFVCIENSCRSQMAEGFARALGAGRVEAHSAGSRPSGQVNPRAIRFMAERAVNLMAQRSKGIAELPAHRWDYVVTMGCGDECPFLPASHRLDWDLPDPKNLDDEAFRDVRDQIEALVKDLIVQATSPEPSPRTPR
jgi:arsenate reductase